MNLRKLWIAQEAIEEYQEAIYNMKEEVAIPAYDKETMKEKYMSALYAFNSKIKSVVDVDNSVFLAEKELHMTNLFVLICKCNSSKKNDIIRNRTRKRKYVFPKQLHVTFLNVTFGLTLPACAALYEIKHETVMHAKKTIRNLYQTDREFRQRFKSVIDLCLEYDYEKTFKFLNDKR